MTSPGQDDLLQRPARGTVHCAQGYLFELERRGQLQAAPFVPEVILAQPEIVREVHRDFVHAGSEVVEALTYYAHREKLHVIGREGQLETMNREALRIAGAVANESGVLFAGNICNTNIYEPDDPATQRGARAMFYECTIIPLVRLPNACTAAARSLVIGIISVVEATCAPRYLLKNGTTCPPVGRRGWSR